MITATDLIERLDGVTRQGEGKWMALCPVHAEQTPSLSVKSDPRRGVLVHCFGCKAGFREVADALGLRAGGSPKPPTPLRQKPPQAPKPLHLDKATRQFPDAARAWAEHFMINPHRRPWPQGVRWSNWPKDAAGSLTFAIVRPGALDEPVGRHDLHVGEDGHPVLNEKGKNKLSRGSQKGAGVLIGRLDGVTRLNLCEGAKDAMAIHWATGEPVWANLGTDDLDALALASFGLPVTIWPDGGTGGETAARRWANQLDLLGGVKVEVATLKPGAGDPAEHFATPRHEWPTDCPSCADFPGTRQERLTVHASHEGWWAECPGCAPWLVHKALRPLAPDGMAELDWRNAEQAERQRAWDEVKFAATLGVADPYEDWCLSKAAALIEKSNCPGEDPDEVAGLASLNMAFPDPDQIRADTMADGPLAPDPVTGVETESLFAELGNQSQ